MTNYVIASIRIVSLNRALFSSQITTNFRTYSSKDDSGDKNEDKSLKDTLLTLKSFQRRPTIKKSETEAHNKKNIDLKAKPIKKLSSSSSSSSSSEEEGLEAGLVKAAKNVARNLAEKVPVDDDTKYKVKSKIRKFHTYINSIPTQLTLPLNS